MKDGDFIDDPLEAFRRADRIAEMIELSEVFVPGRLRVGQYPGDADAPRPGWLSQETSNKVRQTPIPIVTFCPRCQMQHVEAEDDVEPHATHDCHGCRASWTPYATWTRGVTKQPRLGYREWILAHHYLRVDPRWVNAQRAAAVLVGEAPGPRSRADLPLFPHPPTSTGGRMLALSGMSAADYLARFARIDLLGGYPSHGWPAASAAQGAAYILGNAPAKRIIMLGNRVATAFGAGLWPLGEWRSLTPGMPAIRLPHPSGKNPQTHDPEIRKMIRVVLDEAGR